MTFWRWGEATEWAVYDRAALAPGATLHGPAIIAEDRDMLESTDPDAIVDMGRKIEKHMPSDRPGMLMRKRLLELLHAHNEEEQPRDEVA